MTFAGAERHNAAPCFAGHHSAPPSRPGPAAVRKWTFKGPERCLRPPRISEAVTLPCGRYLPSPPLLSRRARPITPSPRAAGPGLLYRDVIASRIHSNSEPCVLVRGASVPPQLRNAAAAVRWFIAAATASSRIHTVGSCGAAECCAAASNSWASSEYVGDAAAAAQPGFKPAPAALQQRRQRRHHSAGSPAVAPAGKASSADPRRRE